MEQKKRSGRPKKAEHEKVQYQRIAVYTTDYEKLSAKVEQIKMKNPSFKLVDAFSEMVAKYVK